MKHSAVRNSAPAFTSLAARLGLLAVIALVAAVALFIASSNPARAHAAGASLTALTVTADGTAQTLSPAFRSTVFSYTVNVGNSVTQVTLAGTPDGDGNVAYQYTDSDSGTDGHQVALPTVGGRRVNVVVTHLESGQQPTTQTYTVLLIRDGTAATDRDALQQLYDDTGGVNPGWWVSTNWGDSDKELREWHGVRTDFRGRVTYLSLPGNDLTGSLPDSLGNLTRLEYLDMTGNLLSGSIPDLTSLTGLEFLYLGNNDFLVGNNQFSGPIPDWLGNLANLRELALWGNQFSGPIPDSLGNLDNLTALRLGGNALDGPIPGSLGNLDMLGELSLWGNQLSGSIPDLSNLTKLRTLDISRNHLDGSIPDLSNLTDLQFVYLWENQLSGSIPDLSSHAGLQELFLNRNQLSGSIPDLSSHAGLTHLFMNHNQLEGPIPNLSNFTRARQIDLSYNELDGPIPNLSGLTSLTHLQLQNNHLSGSIPDLSSLTSMQIMAFGNNELTGSFPDSLRHLTGLLALGLNGNDLDGAIPAFLGQLFQLQHLFLSNNNFDGVIPDALGDVNYLTVTRLAGNSLTGCVPNELRYILTNPDFVPDEFDSDRVPMNLPAHDFIAVDANGDGDTDDDSDTPGLNLPFCMVSALTFSDVNLAPVFASATATYTARVAASVESTTVTATLAGPNDSLSIAKGASSYENGAAVPLDFGLNEITLTVTPTDGTPTLTYNVNVFREAVNQAALMALYNSAGGSGWTVNTNWDDPDATLNTWHGVTTDGSGRVTGLELPDNNLRGTLPAEMGTLTSLNALDLSDNGLRGQIPDLRELTILTILNLGDNQLDGEIPAELGSLTRLQELSLRNNQFTGPIPEELGELSLLRTLYLDDNQLSGAIPDWLGDLFQLSVLYLNGNQLSGCVPDALRLFLIDNHDFIAVDANGDGDTADAGDTPGLPFCTLNWLAFSADPSDLTLNPEFASSTTTYTASAAHDVATTTVTALLNNSSNTVSLMKGADTYASGDSLPLGVGANVIDIQVARPDDPLTPHSYTVTVTRAANAPPTFDEGANATRNVVENAIADVDIGEPVAATDEDDDILTYSLDANGAESFDIDASSGQLRTKAALNFEDQSRYSMTVSVSDRKNDDGDADEEADATIAVTILVTNINETPEFQSTETGERNVDENTLAGMNIGKPFTATDEDDDILTYSLDANGAESFDIDASSGQLRTKAALNFEDISSYRIAVTATDPVGASADLPVVIVVGNVDEKGTVRLSTVQPIVGEQITADVFDLDSIIGSVTWSWASSANRTTGWTPVSNPPAPPIGDVYTPIGADEGRYVQATASYTDGEGPGKSRQQSTVNPVGPAPTLPNNSPFFPSTETGERNVDENTLAGMNIGEPFKAIDEDGDTLTYSLRGVGAEPFDIDESSGQLRATAALDFEDKSIYTVTVFATDPGGLDARVQVTIALINLDEPGTVMLSSLQPLVATPLTASLNDPDKIIGNVIWTWTRSANGATGWTLVNEGSSDFYTPVIADLGNYLRVTASYADEAGFDERNAQATTAAAVAVAPGRNKPVFREYPTATRSFPRNTPAGTNIGDPISAIDVDNDALHYSLGGPDRNSFDLDASSGQLRTKAVLTGINRTSYNVFVSVHDGKDDLGDPDTAIDATTEVIITLTTRASSSGSGGGGGGRRPPPEPVLPVIEYTLKVIENRFVMAPGNPDLNHNIPHLEVTFPDHQVLSADFLRHYDETGGLTRWGYPTSEVMVLEDGTLTQFYQRGVVDFHDVGQGWVVERRLAWDYVGGGVGGSEDQGTEPGVTNPHVGASLGPWGHKVSDFSIDGTPIGFAEFFNSIGGVDAFGLPKSDAREDTGAPGTLRQPQSTLGFIRQYFQAAVLEFHPDDPAGQTVKLTLLGDTLRGILVPDFAEHPPFSKAEQLVKEAAFGPYAVPEAVTT